MSVQLTLSDALHHAAAPNGGGSFSVVISVRRDADTAGEECVFSRNNDSWSNQDSIIVDAGGEWDAVHKSSYATPAPLSEGATTGVWRHFLYTYTEETTSGSSTDGQFALKYIADGDLSGATSFDAVATGSGVEDENPDQVILGARTLALEMSSAITVAQLKLFEGVITDAQAITELRFRNPQITAWAAYKFANGALTTDDSGNSRTLTAIGSPSYAADEPTAIEGDDPGGDTTPPALTSATASATGATTGSGGVTTDEGNGTLYFVVTESATAPSVAQIQAGQDHTGSAAVDDGSQAVSATGTQNVAASGLTASTTYYFHYQHQDAATNDSSVASSSSFTTDAVTTVSIDQSDPQNVEVGASGTLTATVTDGSGSTSWSSDDASVSINSSTGAWTADGTGTATITATNNGVSDTITVNVSAAVVNSENAVAVEDEGFTVSATLAASVRGTVTLSGSPVSGATVRLVDLTDEVYVGDTTTNASGEYSFGVASGVDAAHLYAVIAENNDGTQYVRARTQITPET